MRCSGPGGGPMLAATKPWYQKWGPGARGLSAPGPGTAGQRWRGVAIQSGNRGARILSLGPRWRFALPLTPSAHIARSAVDEVDNSPTPPADVKCAMGR